MSSARLAGLADMTTTANQPRVTERAAQPYVYVSGSVTMNTFGKIADRIPELFDWLGQHDLEPAGPPFFKYNVIDMERELLVEAGVPTTVAAVGDGDVSSGVLPSGRYVSVHHVGHPDQLIDATARLLEWADMQRLSWDRTDTSAGEAWGCRLEIFHTNPAEQPDLNQWDTELAFRLAD